MATTKRAGILARISLDPDGEAESPDQQLADGRDLAQQRSAEVVATYVERDVSGYKQRERPEYDRLIADMRAGKLDVVIVWAIDRLTRQGVVGIAKFLQVMDETGVALISVTQPFLDTTTALGRGVLGLIASLAQAESENTSTRLKRSHRFSAQAGKPHSGGSRHFGYRQTVRGVTLPDAEGEPGTIVESEEAAIHEAIERVKEGQSLRSIARDFNTRDIKTPMAGQQRKRKGKPYICSGDWSARSLSQMLRSPRIAAINEREGERYAGTWEPIISETEHDEIVQLLTTTTPSARRGKRHLLTGLVRCGNCGGAMATSFYKKNGVDYPRYACVKDPGNDRCGKVAVVMSKADEYITDQLLRFLSVAQLRPLEGDDNESELQDQLIEAQGAMSELVRERFVLRTLTPAHFEGARGELQAQIDALDRRMEALKRAKADRTATLPLGDLGALRAWWEGASGEERRAAVRWAVRDVEVFSVGRRGQFSSDRMGYMLNWSVLMLSADKAGELTPEAEAEYIAQNLAAQTEESS